MGEVMDTFDQVLVGRVQGRAYSATHLKQWVLEIWGHILPEFLSVVTHSRGWFKLRFQRLEFIPWVLSKH